MKRRRITLIALVVTIIILLILAAVSITFVLGPNGMIAKARQSKAASRYSQIRDLEDVRKADILLKSKMGEKDIETEDQFVERLKVNKITSATHDFYDTTTKTLHVGRVGENEFLYSVALTTSDPSVIENILKLPTVEDNPEMANMT